MDSIPLHQALPVAMLDRMAEHHSAATGNQGMLAIECVRHERKTETLELTKPGHLRGPGEYEDQPSAPTVHVQSLITDDGMQGGRNVGTG